VHRQSRCIVQEREKLRGLRTLRPTRPSGLCAARRTRRRTRPRRSPRRRAAGPPASASGRAGGPLFLEPFHQCVAADLEGAGHPAHAHALFVDGQDEGLEPLVMPAPGSVRERALAQFAAVAGVPVGRAPEVVRPKRITSRPRQSGQVTIRAGDNQGDHAPSLQQQLGESHYLVVGLHGQ
jgi:hypothetical protein